MLIQDEVHAIERQLADAGITIASVLIAADVDRSTWTRWRNGIVSPRLSTWRAVERAVQKALSKSIRANPEGRQ